MTTAARLHEVRLTRPTATTDCQPGDAADLARRFVAGDPQVLDQVIRRYHAAIHRRVRYLMGEGPAADDVVQEVFLRALERHGQFRAGSSLETWLTRIALNCCRVAWRRERLRRLLPDRWMVRRTRAAAPADPAQGAETGERALRVRRAVAALPAPSREVVALYYLEEMSCAEVAQLLRLSEQAVRQRLVRARARLVRSLSDFE